MFKKVLKNGAKTLDVCPLSVDLCGCQDARVTGSNISGHTELKLFEAASKTANHLRLETTVHTKTSLWLYIQYSRER